MILLFVGLLYKGLLNQITMLLWTDITSLLRHCLRAQANHALFGRAPLFNDFKLRRFIDIWLLHRARLMIESLLRRVNNYTYIC